jgi:hypothetical protein
MTIRSAMIIGSLTLGSLGIASAKTYSFRLDNPTKVGETELKPGDYHVKLEGSAAVFTKMENAKSWTIPAAIESNPTKFPQTIVLTNSGSGVATLKEIDLGGSTTKLEFGK